MKVATIFPPEKMLRHKPKGDGAVIAVTEPTAQKAKEYKTYPYKGKYGSYPKWHRDVTVTSFIRIKGRKAIYTDPNLDEWVQEIPANAAWEWFIDEHGIGIRHKLVKGLDYHFESAFAFRKADPLRAYKIGTDKAIANAKIRRANALGESDLYVGLSRMLDREVTIDDSSAAGNCRQGTRSFADAVGIGSTVTVRNLILIHRLMPPGYNRGRVESVLRHLAAKGTQS